MKRLFYLKVVIFSGLLISLEVVLTRFIQIPAEWFIQSKDRISLGFLPIALSGALFGPAVGGLTAAISDIIRANLFPQGAFNPVFTLSAALRGAIYGLFLYKKAPGVLRLVAVSFAVFVLINAGLNSLWMVLFYKTSFKVFFMQKLALNTIRFAVESLILALVLPPLLGRIKNEIMLP